MTERRPSHPPEQVRDLIEEITGKHDLVKLAAEAAAKTAAEEVLLRSRSAAPPTPGRPGWIDAALVIALVGAISAAAVAIFKADVAYSDHDTTIQLKTLVPQVLDRLGKIEEHLAAAKRSPPSPAPPAPTK